MDESNIHEILSELLLGGRLPPGTKLVEQKLAKVFGVSRERIRKVLQRLGYERLLDLIPNRGAFVVEPTLEEARRIYDARRILEAGIVFGLAGDLSAERIEKIKGHLAQEETAARTNNRAASIRLSRDFHLLLAEMTGSDLIEQQMHELVSRTSMLVALHEPGSLSGCGCDEHASIVSALARHDPGAAARTMISHLSMIETRLKPVRVDIEERDLEELLRDEIAELDIEAAEGLSRPVRHRVARR